MERLKTQEEIQMDRVVKRVKVLKGFYKHLLIYIIFNVVLLGMNYYEMKPGEIFFKFSTFSTLFFWGIGVAFHAFNVFGKNIFLGDNWEERKINEYMEQHQNSKWE